MGISEILPVFAARCRGVSPVCVLFRMVSSVSFDKFVPLRFCFSEVIGVRVIDFSQVGHGAVSPVPSDGYSMDWPQCGHSHLRKSLIDSLVEIQTPIAPIVHPKMNTRKSSRPPASDFGATSRPTTNEALGLRKVRLTRETNLQTVRFAATGCSHQRLSWVFVLPAAGSNPTESTPRSRQRGRHVALIHHKSAARPRHVRFSANA